MRRSTPLFLALALAGCASDQSIRQQAEEMHRELAPAVLTDQELVGYLAAMGDRIVLAAQQLSSARQGPAAHFEEDSSWMFSTDEFHLVSSDQLNAFTTGGSHMYVFAQLLATCRSEDELAAVMAHEFAHVYCRHVHNGMDRYYATLGATAVLGLAGYMIGGDKHGEEYMGYGAALGMIAGNFLSLGYTRDDEAEADAWGFQFYARAGWDPARFGDFFQQLIDQGYDTTPEVMSDHPTLASRVAAAKQLAAGLPASAAAWRRAPVGAGSRFEAMRARARQHAVPAPEGSAIARAQLLLRALPSCLLPQDPAATRDAQVQLVLAEQALKAAP